MQIEGDRSGATLFVGGYGERIDYLSLDLCHSKCLYC